MAGDSNKMDIFVGIVDNASAGIDKIGRSVERMAGGINRSSKTSMEQLKELGNSFMSLGKRLTTTLSIPLAAFSVFAAKGAADFNSVHDAFERMTGNIGLDSDELLAKLTEISQGTISQKDLVLGANRAMALGVASSMEDMTQLLEIARLKAREMGLTTTQAFNDIVTGLGRGSPLILDNLGIVVKLGEAQEKLAEDLGVTVGELTEFGKKTALISAVMDKANEELKVAGELALNDADRFQQFTASAKDLRVVIGNELLPHLIPLIEKATELVKWFGTLDDKTKKMILVLGALAIVLPPIIFAVGALITVIAALASPIGVIVLALGGLVAWIILTGKNMKAVAENWPVLWNAIVDATEKAVNFTLVPLNWLISALNKLGANIEPVRADFSKFHAELSSGVKEAHAYSSTIDDVASTQNEATGSVEKTSEALFKLKDDSEKTGKEAEKMAEQMAKAFESLEGSAGGFLDSLNDGLDEARSNIKDLQQQMMDLLIGKIEDTQSERQRLADAFVKTEEDVAVLRKQLEEETDAEKRRVLQESLDEMEEQLKEHANLEIALAQEVTDARARATKSELELALEAFQKNIFLIEQRFEKERKELDKKLAKQRSIEQSLLDLKAEASEMAQSILLNEEQVTIKSLNRQIDAFNRLAEAVRNARAGKSTQRLGLGETLNAIGGISSPSSQLTTPITATNAAGQSVNVNITVNGDVSGEELVQKVGDELVRTLQLNMAVP